MVDCRATMARRAMGRVSAVVGTGARIAKTVYTVYNSSKFEYSCQMASLGRDASVAAAGKRLRRPRVEIAFDKVIRDSFTMPAADYELIGVLKQRCIGLGIAMKKSELLRAGLAALDLMPDQELAQVVATVESVKTGRPPGKKKRKKGKRRKKSNRTKRKKK